MNDALVVRELQSVADLRDDRQRFGRRQSAGVKSLPQGGAVDQFHDEVVEAVRFAKLMHGDDRRVIQLGQCAGFAREAFGKGGIFADFRRQDFQSDVAVEPRLTRFVNGSHASLAQQLDDFELREMRRQFFGGGGDKARMARGGIASLVSGRLEFTVARTPEEIHGSSHLAREAWKSRGSVPALRYRGLDETPVWVRAGGGVACYARGFATI